MLSPSAALRLNSAQPRTVEPLCGVYAEQREELRETRACANLAWSD